jgi:type IV pilus biogenesis protein PilP
MQNRKFKKLSIGVSLAIVGLMANAQAVKPQNVQMQESVPLKVAAPSPQNIPMQIAQPDAKTSVSYGASGDVTLEEISKLKAKKAKLIEEKEIAKLTAEIAKLKVGDKPTVSAMPSSAGSFASMQMQLPGMSMSGIQAPAVVSVTSIYGSGKKLTAEIMVGRTKVVAKVGTVLPSGESVTAIESDYVTLSIGKKSKRVSPTNDFGVPFVAQSNYAQGGNPTSPPTIQPFNPADLIAPPPPMQTDVPPGQGANVSSDDKKMDSM